MVHSAKGTSMDPRYGDMSEHRVSTLSSLRRNEDPENSRDPRIRSVVDALKNVDYAPAPDARFRADLRAQLVAVAPRIVAESTPDVVAAPTTHRRSTVTAGSPLSDQLHRRRFVRPLAVAAGVAAAFLLLLGGAVFLSQKALPGDSLYGLKRAGENVQLSLTSGGTDRGQKYLSLAQTRVEEAQQLLSRDSASASGGGTLAGGLSTHTAQLIAANLGSADSDLQQGTDLLNTQAISARSQSPITLIKGWAPGQLRRLQDLSTALPAGSLQNRTKSSWTLTDSALTRARALSSAVASGCASTSRTDRLGPVPTCAATPASSTPTTPATRAPTTPAARRTSGRSHGTAGTTATPNSGQHRSSTSAAGTSTASPSSSPLPALPTLPAVPTKAPVSVGSCRVSVALGPIGVNVGSCPSHS